MRQASYLLAALSLLAGFPATAAPLTEVFSLGQSGANGSICEAVRDYQDPLGQGSRAKAWRLRCRGYTTVLGRIYQLPVDKKVAWQSALSAKADCGAQESAPGGLPAQMSTCKLGQGAVPYVVFVSEKGQTLTIAEGLAPLADVIETALKVALGTIAPPVSAAVQTSAAQAEIAADFPNMSGLAAAEAAARVDPQRLRARGYVQNNEWNFDAAETAFRALVNDSEAQSAPAAQRSDALLNLAMNISNNGRFDEANGYFLEAEAQIPADDLILRARSLNYRALHERNRGRFDAAIAAAREALQLRAAAGAARSRRSEDPAATGAPGQVLVIEPGVARLLNRPSAAQSAIETSPVTVAEQLEIQDAQAWQVIGTSQAAMGQPGEARASLGRARAILLRSATIGRLTAWLQARVEADLADLDVQDGRNAEAAIRYRSAIQILRTRHAGSSAEAAMLLDLGRAEAGAGRDSDALATYARAMAIFRLQRGGLGASADQAAPYFDLLLKSIKSDPAKAGAYGALFFDASQTVVSNATAETVNRLAARVAAGDSVTSGLSRAFEDALRRLRVIESQIAALQAAGGDSNALRTEMEVALRAAQAEADGLEARLLAANPRYNQLVATGAPVAGLQKVLKLDEVYVKILPLAGRTFGVLLTSSTVKPFAVDISRAEVKAAVTHLRQPLQSQEQLLPFDAAASGRLFDTLFGPVKSEVLAARHLIYEPAGPLVSLPVSLFVSDLASIHTDAKGEVDYLRTAWLGTRVNSSLVVSGASFLQSRAFAASRARQPYLGFGDPALPRGEARAFTSMTRSILRRSSVLERVCGDTRNALLQIEALPETALEVQQIGESLGTPLSIVTGAAFSDDAIRGRSDLADYRVLYFATHGLLPQPEACVPEPALVTSLGLGDSDALLDSSEILDLKLDSDLVVLAACDTGGGGASIDRTGLTGGGEALGGLTRAMIYAGSRALLVSHWSIESESAVRLMTGFFGAKAQTMAQSLQASQLALQKDPRYAHPYFWAPFTLVGDGERALPAQR